MLSEESGWLNTDVSQQSQENESHAGKLQKYHRSLLFIESFFFFLSRCHQKLFYYFILFYFIYFTVVSVAYGSSQAWSQIGAAAASLYQRHSNAGSELHLQPSQKLVATPDP